MFQPHSGKNDRNYFVAIVGLLALSTAALGISIWTMVDFWREQKVVTDLYSQLSVEGRESARFLVGELRWQFRLSALVILNVVVTGIAVVLLWRAYRQSQLSLRDVKALASDVLGSMEQAVLTTDREGILTSINRRGQELLNLSPSAVGQSLANVSPVPLEPYRQEWIDSSSNGIPREFTLDRGSDKRTLRAFCVMLTDQQGRDMGTVLQVRDVTESKWIEQRMRRMERYMGLGSLAAGLHHEIRNPLAALSLHFQLLEENLDVGEMTEENRQTFGVIRSELARIARVLESFRDFASIEQLHLREIDVNDLVERQVALLSPQALSRSVEIQFMPSTVCRLHADAGHLEQALLNLMINSMEAMPDGGVLSIRTLQKDDWAIIEVEDTGHGISADVQDKVLDPYFSTKASGTGLGLAFCDKIAREHSGSLDFTSSGAGTVFRLSLPVDAQVSAEAVAPNQESAPNARSANP